MSSSKIGYIFDIMITLYKMQKISSQEPLTSQEESEKVQIYFSARNLKNDFQNGTFLKVYLQQTNKPKKQVLQTKSYHNDINPDFSQTLVTNFYFQVRQKIIIQVFSQNVPPQLIGTVEASIGQIFGCKTKGLTKKLMNFNEQHKGELLIKCEKIQKGNNNFVQFDLQCSNLHVGSSFFCFWTVSAFFRIYKTKNNEEYLAYQSQPRQGKQNRYNHIKIFQKKICNENPEQPIRINFYKENAIEPVLIGTTQISMTLLNQGRFNHQIRNNNKNKGYLTINNYEVTKQYQFTDYLVSGMQMALVICIDFTASNGDHQSLKSLHYSSATKKSQYEEALLQTANIVMDYDADKLVPTYGFGAQVSMPNFQSMGVNHFFPLNGNDKDPNFQKVQGIMQGYRNCMKYLKFSGPTYFAPLLKELMKECQQMKKNQKQYMILLILTDGEIHDIKQVKDLLVKCGRLPLSIMIIGIGNGNWKLMHQLDDDDCQMTDLHGNKTQRDLVQFVEFNQFQGDGVLLAKQLLQQLPRQVEQYHELCKLSPSIYENNKFK